MASRKASSGWTELRLALANREWRALFVAALLSAMGDQLARVALALIIYSRTGSAAQSALAFAISFLPYLLGAALTDIGDRRPRRSVMLVCDLLRVVLAGAMAVPHMGIGLLLALYFLLGLAEPPFEAARAALAAEILGPDAYAAGHGLQQSSFALVGGAGVLAAGILVSASGATTALLVNAATFAVSAAIVATRIHSGRESVAVEARVSIAGGFRVIARSEMLRTVLLLAAAGAVFTIPVDVLAAPISHGAGHGPAAASVLLAAPLMGAIVSSVLVTRVPPVDRDRLMPRIAAASFLPLALFVFQPGFIFACVLAAVAGLFTGYQVLANQRFMLAIAPEDRSKTFGAASAVLMAGQGIASAVAGGVADYVEAERVVGIAGTIALGISAYVAYSLPRKGLRANVNDGAPMAAEA